VSDKKDILADVAADEANRNCKHLHMRFELQGAALRCIDCKRRYLAGWTDPNTKMETFMFEFGYHNPKIADGSFRHSQEEPVREKPLDEKPKAKPKT